MLRGVRIRRRRRQVRKLKKFHAWIVMVSPWWVPITRKLNIYAVDISFVNPVGRIGSIPVMEILVFVPCVVKMSGNRPPQRVTSEATRTTRTTTTTTATTTRTTQGCYYCCYCYCCYCYCNNTRGDGRNNSNNSNSNCHHSERRTGTRTPSTRRTCETVTIFII